MQKGSQMIAQLLHTASPAPISLSSLPSSWIRFEEMTHLRKHALIVRFRVLLQVPYQLFKKVRFSVKGINPARPAARLLWALEGKYLACEDARKLMDDLDCYQEADELQCVQFSSSAFVMNGRSSEATNRSYSFVAEEKIKENCIGCRRKGRWWGLPQEFHSSILPSESRLRIKVP